MQPGPLTRDNLTFSVAIGVPEVVVGATNIYPVYRQPQTVYVRPRTVYVQPQPVFYGRPHGWHGTTGMGTVMRLFTTGTRSAQLLS